MASHRCRAAASKIPEGPEPRLLALGMGLMDDVRDREVEQIQGIIHRDDFEGPCKGEQGGQPALWGHARNGLSPCCSTIAG